MPLPCSNLPLDHSRQGHRVHYTDWSEGRERRTTGRLNKEQGASLKRLEGEKQLSNFVIFIVERGQVCTDSHTQGWDCTGHMWRLFLQSLNYSCLLAHADQHRSMLLQHTHIHTREQPRPHLNCPPIVKGEEQISAMRCLRAASTDGEGTYDGAEPSCA